MLLEATKHSSSSFVTLTYSDDRLPEGGTLVPRHPQGWLKRLRKAYKKPLRFFLVGEYGVDQQRPHYHVALFGYEPCKLGNYSKCESKHCYPCRLIEKTWNSARAKTGGFISNGTLTQQSAHYIAKYVTKKWTNGNDPWVQERLKGRHEEFARMSNQGGIGLGAVSDLRDRLTTHKGSFYLSAEGDVPSFIQYGKKREPLGRYLRGKLREAYGFGTNKIPEEKSLEIQANLQALYETAKERKETEAKNRLEYQKEIAAPKILNLEARALVFKQRKKI